MNRYQHLFEIVRDLNPKHAVEIGTWAGKRAIEWMALTDCYYTGFDLFEEATKETDELENNVKQHTDMCDVAKHIEMTGLTKFTLIRGNTNETLPKMVVTEDVDVNDPTTMRPFDFAFIDGGHSTETINNDFEWVMKNISPGGTIILDDYYLPEQEGVGCNHVEGELIGPSDPVKGGYKVRLLRVQA